VLSGSEYLCGTNVFLRRCPFGLFRGFGITLKACTVEEILRTVRDASGRSARWRGELSRQARDIAREYYTEQRFLTSSTDAVEYIIRQAKESRTTVRRPHSVRATYKDTILVVTK